MKAKKSGKFSSTEARRICSFCFTSTTPLWRVGPTGPKSLCNACGIKYTKEKRENLGMRSEKKMMKMKRVRLMRENLGMSEVERAAILLMALSYGDFSLKKI